MVLVILFETTSPTRCLRLPVAATFSATLVVASAIQNYFAAGFAAWLLNAEMRVSTRAMSLRSVRKRAGVSNCALACCRRRLNISCRRSRPLAANSTSVISLISANFIGLTCAVMARNKLGFDRQLRRGEAHGFARFRLGDTVHFKQNVRRTNHGHPAFEGRFALAHARFQRLLRVRFLGKHPDPHLAD